MLSGASAVVLSLFCSGSRTRRPDDSRHVRRPGVETDAHSECLPEGGGGGRRLRACRDLCQARRDQCAGGPGPLPAAAGERRARGGAAPHTGTSSPGRTRRTGPTAGSPTHHAQGVADGGSRGHGSISERSHLGGHRRQPAGGVHETGHGQDGGDVGGGRRVCPLPARRQQATHHRRRAAHRQLPIGGAVPRRGHLAPGEPDAHAGVGGAAAGGQDPDLGGAARPPRIQAQAGVRPRRAGAAGGIDAADPGDRDGRRQSEGHDRDDDDGLSRHPSSQNGAGGADRAHPTHLQMRLSCRRHTRCALGARRRSSSADGRQRQSSAMCSRHHWQWRRASRPSARRAGRGDPGGRLLGTRANVEFVPPPARVPVDRAVEGSTPAFIMNCIGRRLTKMPRSGPTGKPDAVGPTACGSSSASTPCRLNGSSAALLPLRSGRCRRARDSSSSSSSSTSGGTSDSD